MRGARLIVLGPLISMCDRARTVQLIRVILISLGYLNLASNRHQDRVWQTGTEASPNAVRWF